MQKDRKRRVGLARALSKLGYCSRARAEQCVREGRVRLNGTVRLDPEYPVRLAADRIEVDGVRITAVRRIYLALNKPRGVVTTTSDEQGRMTVCDFLGKDLPWVAPLGRLDKASEGLLFLTNDTEWGQRMLDPQTHLEKTYQVQVDGETDEVLLARLGAGVREGGAVLRARRVRRLRAGARTSWLEIVLDEGKNRQIRRMLEVCGLQVLRLVRVAIGPIVIGDLPKGSVRSLTAGEKAALDAAMKGSSSRSDVSGIHRPKARRR
jgi:23S rRNA pseudouridine2605 synthase